MTTSLRDPWGDFQTNVVGALNLLECLRLNHPETALLYSSSNKVYGALSTVRLLEGQSRYEAPDFPGGLDELLPIDLRTPYGCSKGAADQYVLEYARTYGLRAAVFRHSTISGGRQYSTFDQGWVGWFCQKAWEQKRAITKVPFTISGDGKQVRDLLHVKDAVSCYLQAFEYKDAISGEAFNIGGGIENSSSLIELFAFLESYLKIDLKYEKINWRHEDQKFFVANTKKYQKCANWSPTISRLRGIEEVLESREKTN
jgi:CDP-paratose 2-epimerase